MLMSYRTLGMSLSCALTVACVSAGCGSDAASTTGTGGPGGEAGAGGSAGQGGHPGTGGTGGTGGTAPGTGGTAGGMGGTGGSSGTGGGPCSPGQRACTDSSHERVCEEVQGVLTWVDRACEPHHYCIDDRCEAACLDECALGGTRMVGGKQETCRLYSTAQSDFVSPGTGMHDRSRLHDAWVRGHHLANGYVAEALHSDVTYATVTRYFGTVDAAEWTGAYLAAESLRLMATRAPDAERMVEAQVERMAQLFEITGAPGYMARFWAPRGVDPLLDDLYDPNDWSHHLTTFAGGDAFWHGWTSRDMYSGAILGLGLAYDALTSEPHREMIREVIVSLVRELIMVRPKVPVTVRFNVGGSWQELPLAFDMQHVVLVPSEMVNGRVFVQVGSNESPSDYDASELVGVREFLPDMRSVLGQTPVVGGLLPPIPRPGTGMMLAYFLRLALHVTDGIPAWASDHAAIQAHYDAQKPALLSLMRQYAYHNEEECWKQYFGITIAFHSMYGLLRIETDQALKTAVQNEVVGGKMWPTVVGHKNPYFDYVVAAHGPAGLMSPAAIADTGLQLSGFVPPPKAREAVDNTGTYPANPDCPGKSSVPVDVKDRVPSDFLWQHHPFELVIPNPEPRLVYSGADYLLAYWLGRASGYLDDDASGTCTRWDPP
jgi:hypothetical protein